MLFHCPVVNGCTAGFFIFILQAVNFCYYAGSSKYGVYIAERGRFNMWISSRAGWFVFLCCLILLCFVLPAESLKGAEPVILKGGFRSFQTPLPQSAQQWDAQKIELRKKLWRLLGNMPPLFTPKAKVDKSESHDGYALEHFTFDNGVGDTVYGYILIPAGRNKPGPAILYNHYHGGKYNQGKEEVITKAFDKLDFATGEALAKEGYVVLCIDAYAFGHAGSRGRQARKKRAGKRNGLYLRPFCGKVRLYGG